MENIISIIVYYRSVHGWRIQYIQWTLSFNVSYWKTSIERRNPIPYSYMHSQLTSQFNEIIDFLTTKLSLPHTNTDFLCHQLQTFQWLHPITPRFEITDLPEDQYHIINILKNRFSNKCNQWSYYFLTGSTGTGKSFVIHHFQSYLKHKKEIYFLPAPTGVAAQNVMVKQFNSFWLHSRLSLL